MVLAGCGTVRGATVGGPAGGFPCGAPEDFSFIGETSLAALGLADQFGGGPDAQRIGSVWVGTSSPVMEPVPAPNGAEPVPMPMRVVCIQWDDGSSMSGSIDDSWQPPGSIAASNTDGGGPPFPLLVIGGSAVVIVGFSIVAFRRDPA
jgi:hypothetical protein